MRNAKYIYRLTQDASDGSYAFLVDALLRENGTFTLVWRDQLRFNKSAQAIRDDLRPFQVRHTKTDCWPGTQLIGHFASVITYRSELSASKILLRPRFLFGWRAPDYPEDICFFASDGSVKLVTISHEADAWTYSQQIARMLSQQISLTREERIIENKA